MPGSLSVWPIYLSNRRFLDDMHKQAWAYSVLHETDAQTLELMAPGSQSVAMTASSLSAIDPLQKVAGLGKQGLHGNRHE